MDEAIKRGLSLHYLLGNMIEVILRQNRIVPYVKVRSFVVHSFNYEWHFLRRSLIKLNAMPPFKAIRCVSVRVANELNPRMDAFLLHNRAISNKI